MTMESQYLTRKEASRYMAQIGLPISPSTLANLAWKNEGPTHYKLRGFIVRYTKRDLDIWVQANLKRVET